MCVYPCAGGGCIGVIVSNYVKVGGGSVRVERVMGWWCEGGSVGAVDQYESEGILDIGVYGVMIVKHH